MGHPIWSAVNKIASADIVRGCALSAGEPAVSGFDYLNSAFPATNLHDMRPGTVAKFDATALRALLAYFATPVAADMLVVANHNLPADATLKLQSSATGLAGSWTDRYTCTAADLGEEDFAAEYASASAAYWALTLTALGSLASPWYVGEWGLCAKNQLPVGWSHGRRKGRGAAIVRARTPYMMTNAKYLGRQKVIEGVLGEGMSDADLATLTAFVEAVNYGASPFFWQNDSAEPECMVATLEGVDELLAADHTPDTNIGISARVVEVPRGRNTV